jgi:hypothetical protein
MLLVKRCRAKAEQGSTRPVGYNECSKEVLSSPLLALRMTDSRGLDLVWRKDSTRLAVFRAGPRKDGGGRTSGVVVSEEGCSGSLQVRQN